MNGIINFDRDANNPHDSNWAFSNALLGNYDTLQQSNQVLNGQYRSWNVEWYVQDNWRITRSSPWSTACGSTGYSPSTTRLSRPPRGTRDCTTPPSRPCCGPRALDSNGNRVSINPLTGESGPAALIGSIVNNGKGFVNGVYANGMGQAGKNGYPKGLMAGPGIQYAPRVGIAYQFDSKTVIRAGGGVFYDRLQGNPVFDMLPNPPSTIIPKFYYGNLGSIPPGLRRHLLPRRRGWLR